MERGCRAKENGTVSGGEPRPMEPVVTFRPRLANQGGAMGQRPWRSGPRGHGSAIRRKVPMPITVDTDASKNGIGIYYHAELEVAAEPEQMEQGLMVPAYKAWSWP